MLFVACICTTIRAGQEQCDTINTKPIPKMLLEDLSTNQNENRTVEFGVGDVHFKIVESIPK